MAHHYINIALDDGMQYVSEVIVKIVQYVSKVIMKILQYVFQSAVHPYITGNQVGIFVLFYDYCDASSYVCRHMTSYWISLPALDGLSIPPCLKFTVADPGGGINPLPPDVFACQFENSYGPAFLGTLTLPPSRILDPPL